MKGETNELPTSISSETGETVNLSWRDKVALAIFYYEHFIKTGAISEVASEAIINQIADQIIPAIIAEMEVR